MAHLAPWRLVAKEFDSREAASRTGHQSKPKTNTKGVSFRFFLCKNFNQVWHTKGIEKNVVLCYNKIEIDTLEQIYAVSYIFIFVSDYNNIFYCS